MILDETLVRRLVTAQFPEWKNLSISPVDRGGWDNRTFRLGEQMLVRMPSDAKYAVQVEKEHQWLPKLAPLLPLPIPMPLALGHAGEGYPWPWSIYRWLEGESAASAHIADLSYFARDLAQFLNALRRSDATHGPKPGPQNFYRGGPLTTYDAEVRKACEILHNKINSDLALKIWDTACATTWQGAPVWVHGDISAGNLLVRDGQLCAIIDFGQLAVGDPACDLVIAWTLFSGESRELFRATLDLDTATWARGRAWALWKALIIAAGLTNTNAVEGEHCWQILDEILADHRNKA